MQPKDVFLRYIANEYSIDYWYDVMVFEAIERANAMPSAEWVAITCEWETFQPIQQIRVAEIASDVKAEIPVTLKMLVSMLSSKNYEVAEASLGSLHALYQQPPEHLTAIGIEDALANFVPVGKINKIFYESLKRHISEQK